MKISSNNKSFNVGYGRLYAKSFDPTSPHFSFNGAMGIRLCERWRDPEQIIKDYKLDFSKDYEAYVIQRVDDSLGWNYNNCWMSKGSFKRSTNPTARKLAIEERTPMRDAFIQERGLPLTRAETPPKPREQHTTLIEVLTQLEALRMQHGALPAVMKTTSDPSTVYIHIEITKPQS